MNRAAPTIAPDVAAVLDALTGMVDAAFQVVDEIAAFAHAQVSLPDPRRTALAGVEALAGSYVGDRAHPVRRTVMARVVHPGRGRTLAPDGQRDRPGRRRLLRL